VLGDQVVDVNSAELWVSLDSSADYGGTLQEIRSVVAGYPGLHGRVSTYQQSRTEEILGQRPSDITVRVFGQDPDVLATKAGEVARMLAGIDGIVAPRVVTTPKQPMLLIEPDLTAAQQLGIKPGDIRRGATALLSGITVGSLYQDQKVFDVVVRGTPATQHSLASVKGLVLDTPHDGHVRLGDVADVRIESRPTVIERADVSRMVDVTASVRGRSVGAVSRDVAARLPSISFPLEHHAELLADPTAGADGAGQRELAVCLAVVIGIFLLLQGACGGWRLAAAILLTVPVALAGSVLATLADGRVLSLGALAGGLTVLALTLRHTVSFVRHGQRLRDRDSVAFGPDLVRRTATQRLRPVLTITFAVATVMLPALLMGDMAGLEIVHPLAVSVLGGLVTATFVALVVVPLLYLRGGADLPAAAAESDIVTDPVVPAQKSATADERRARRGGPRR
jgi:Cu/Ag efflux pump CusA